MKKLIMLSSLAMLFSCGEKSGPEDENFENILSNMTYTVDTVVVDPGEEFFNVGYGLGAMGLTSDQSHLLFFENDPLKLVRVNLNELYLLSKTDFEREGPHGIGSYISNMQVESKDELFLLTNITASIFNSEGKIIRALKTIPSGIEEELAQDFNFLYSAAIYDSKESKIYSTPSSSKTGNNELFVIDLEQNTAKSIPIPNMKIMDDMSILFALAPGKNALFRYHPQQKFVSLIGDQLLISSSAMSGIYSYHTQRDSLEFIDVQHQTEPNKMELSITNKPTEEATFLEDQRKVSAHINYMEPKWDASREMFFRLGKKTFMPEDKNDPTTYELYLFAYDSNFNVLGETKIDGLERVPSSYFWKNGKLYSYVNVEDELGFAVFDFDF